MYDLLPVISGICVWHGKMYDLLSVICWFLYEAW